MANFDVSAEIDKNMRAKKISNPSTYAWENGGYLQSIIDDSLITCNETVEATKASLTTFYSRNYSKKNFSKKKVTHKIDNFCIFPACMNYHITIDNL